MGVLEVIASSVIGGVSANHLVGLTIYKTLGRKQPRTLFGSKSKHTPRGRPPQPPIPSWGSTLSVLQGQGVRHRVQRVFAEDADPNPELALKGHTSPAIERSACRHIGRFRRRNRALAALCQAHPVDTAIRPLLGLGQQETILSVIRGKIPRPPCAGVLEDRRTKYFR